MTIRRSIAWLVIAVAVAIYGGKVSTQPGAIPRLKERMTAAEFDRAGLHRLTTGELSALESWLSAHYQVDVRSPARALTLPARGAPVEMVMFNTSNGKFHCASCTWAQRCTRNCVSMPLSQAGARGVPCKVCGGSCR